MSLLHKQWVRGKYAQEIVFALSSYDDSNDIINIIENVIDPYCERQELLQF